ncbi:MAG TPA: adenylyltransferase/cytidyltransferase family protein [Dissulfurispiraceae bacterium]|nr:adenylyltransferase/cytidyltransferase family protein [Dissulfurispiraceae bacterium]
MTAKRTLMPAVRTYANIYTRWKELERIVRTNMKLPLAAILEQWRAPGRYYHDLSHLDNLIGQIYELSNADRVPLVLLALMHDVIYDSRLADNEDASREYFERNVKPGSAFREIVSEGIENTKYAGLNRPKSEVIRAFLLMDLKGLLTGDMKLLLSDEKMIFKEYQWVDYSMYRDTRPGLLVRTAEHYNWLLPKREQAASLDRVRSFAAYLQERRPNVGIYAGSFNPFHVGHMDVLHQAEKIFDKVIIAVGMNPEKSDTQNWESIVQQRTSAIMSQLPYHQVEAFRGFLAHYLKSKTEVQDVTLIRGIRDGFDLRQEVIQLRYVQQFYPDLKVIYIPCKKEFEHVSSSWLRLLESIEPGSSAPYLCESRRL